MSAHAALWRLLIPSWRFFDQLGAAPRLFARPGGSEGDDGWRALLAAPPPARPWALWFNPRGNEFHARMNLLERFVLEAQSTDSLAELVSYDLLLDFIARELGVGPGAAVEFRITSHGEEILRVRA